MKKLALIILFSIPVLGHAQTQLQTPSSEYTKRLERYKSRKAKLIKKQADFNRKAQDELNWLKGEEFSLGAVCSIAQSQICIPDGYTLDESRDLFVLKLALANPPPTKPEDRKDVNGNPAPAPKPEEKKPDAPK